VEGDDGGAVSVMGRSDEEGLVLAKSPPSSETGTESVLGAEMMHTMVERNITRR
jgi:hypothetical protein